MKWILFLGGWFMAFAAWGQEAEFRIWTATNGSRIEARYVSHEGPRITLESRDGRKAVINYHILSPADQAHMQAIVKGQSDASTPSEPAVDPADPDMATPPVADPPPAGAGGEAEGPGWVIGRISELEPSKKDPLAKYQYYLPPGFEANRRYPALFVLSAHGGSEALMKQFTEGADKFKWILLMPKASQVPEEDILDKLNDLAGELVRTFPVDPDRIYASGSQTSVGNAVYLSDEAKGFRVAGLIVSDGGAREMSPPSRTVMVALCPAQSRARVEMARLWDAAKNRASKLVFYEGESRKNPPKEDLYQALRYLTVQFHKQPGLRRDPIIEAEHQALIEELFSEIKDLREFSPPEAYERVALLDGLKLPMQRNMEFTTLKQELEKDPKVKNDQAARRDLDKFVEKHFAGSRPSEREKIEKDAKKYLEKYRDTLMEPWFKALAEEAK